VPAAAAAPSFGLVFFIDLLLLVLLLLLLLLRWLRCPADHLPEQAELRLSGYLRIVWK